MLNPGIVQFRDWSSQLSGVQSATNDESSGASSLVQKGNEHWLAGDHQAAWRHYLQALEIDPMNVAAWSNLGAMKADEQDHETAAEFYHRAIAIDPNHAAAHYNLGNSYRALKRTTEAMECYQHTLRILPSFSEAWTNQGVIWLDCCDLINAEKCYREALRLNPSSPMALNGLGLTLMHLGQYAESRRCIEQALALAPQLSEAHYNHGLLCLLEGDYTQGWQEYEWRWQLPESRPREMPFPQWQGEDLTGKRLLVHTEQGIGDSIQFIRFLSRLQCRGASVTLECPARLAALLGSSHGIDRILHRGMELPPCDYHIPLLSLGAYLVCNDEDLRNEIPYLNAGSHRTDWLKSQLREACGLRVGIAWRGSPGFRWDRLRSINLGMFEPLSKIPGTVLISLQKGPGSEELLQCDWPIVDLGSLLDNGDDAMLDTAAAISMLDLIISVDSSIAHLAGALGRPVWVALPISPDWRWGTSGRTSPWYPTATLFRQSRNGDWASVVDSIGRELRKLRGT